MKPIGPLMIEHRLFERMLAILGRELQRMRGGTVDQLIIAEAVDFFRTYADLNHHGKEEDILFKALSEKPLTSEHRVMIEGLVADHAVARGLIDRTATALVRHVNGDREGLHEMISCVTELLRLYPVHIEKEDRHFFLPVMEYLSSEEQKKMLEEFSEFERGLLQRKYRSMVERLEGKA